MRMQNLLLASLLLGLYGCQPDAPVQQEAVPVTAAPSVSEVVSTVPETVESVSESVAEPVANAEPAVKVAAAPVVSEADALALAKKNNCLACHAIDKKMVGPTWKAVAAKYRGDTGAEAHLVNKIAKGGSGVWGSMRMPGNSRISEADRTTLARFVLSLQ